MTKKKPSLVLMIGFVAAFSAHADRIVEGDLILAGTSDGDAPAYDCSADTLPFIPGPVPTIGTVPAGDPILIPVPDFTN